MLSHIVIAANVLTLDVDLFLYPIQKVERVNIIQGLQRKLKTRRVSSKSLYSHQPRTFRVQYFPSSG